MENNKEVKFKPDIIENLKAVIKTLETDKIYDKIIHILELAIIEIDHYRKVERMYEEFRSNIITG